MTKLYSRFLFPSVIILNKLKFTWKFSIIFILYLIPVAYVAFISLTEHTKSIEQAVLERTGLQYMGTIRPLFEHMAQTRGMTNAYLKGRKGLKQKITDKRSIVEKDLERLIKADNQYGKILKTDKLVSSILNDWNRVVEYSYSMEPEKSFAAHTAVIDKVLLLKVYVFERSKLLLDPSLDSNFMANSLSIRIPTLAENMGKARGLGAGIIESGSFTPETFLKLTNFIQNINNSNTAMMHGFDVVFENNVLVKEKLYSLIKNANSATQKFMSLTRKDVLGSGKITIDSETYFSQGTQAITENLKLYDTLMSTLDVLMQARIKKIENNITINIASSLVLILCAFYILGGFQRSLMDSIKSIKEVVHSMADGDLTAKVKLATKDEMRFIADDLNMMIEKTNALVSQVISSSNQVVVSSNQSGELSDETLNDVYKENQELELVATAMNQMSTTVHEVANHAASTAEATRSADTEANNGRAVVNQTIREINELSSDMQNASSVIQQLDKDSDSIGSVLDVIRGIAEQTNLLALNAAIEAARAGEQGRGFAVVADEVRTLASRTQDSTHEIQTMIAKLQQGSRNAVKLMDEGSKQTEVTVAKAAEAGAALEAINSAVDHITSMNAQIASAAEEQSCVAEEINRNVMNVSDIAKHTLSNANQTAESSVSLKGVALQLQSLVAEFKVN